MIRSNIIALAAAALLGGFLLPAAAQTSFPGTTLGITPTSPAITSGAFTANSGSVAPVPESSGTTDTIVTVNGGKAGEKIIVRAPTGKSLFLDNGAGNLVLKADAFLDDNDSITLQKVGSSWYEVARSIENFLGGDVEYDSLYDMARAIAASPISSSVPRTGGSLTIDGEDLGNYSFVLKKGDQTVSTFTESDWFTSDADDNCAFVVVNGNLTINGDRIIRPANRKLCTVVYVTGNLTYGAGVALGNNPFSVTDDTPTITVTHATHGKSVGDVIHISGSSAVGGVTPSGEYTILTVPTADTYTIGLGCVTDATCPTSTATGGGASVVLLGGISMTARGANHSATGSNITAANIQIIEGTHSAVVDPNVPATSGDGGAAQNDSNGGFGTLPGATGQSAATAGVTGGGGGGSGGYVGGAAGCLTTNFSGPGAEATAFSSGTGGGAVVCGDASAHVAEAAGANGGKGGDAIATTSGAKGGIGNPAGASDGTSTTQPDGTAGTLIVIAEGAMSGTGAINSRGTNGGTSLTGDQVGGGGSGGGHVTVLTGSDTSTMTPSAAGGAGGVGVDGTLPVVDGRRGGSGGDGTARELTLTGATAWSGWDGIENLAFTGLADTPKSYLNQDLKLPQVNETDGVLDFTDPNDLQITSTQAGALARALSEHLSDVVNAANYSPAADCSIASGGTDDTDELQAAIDDAGSGYLLIPPGVYCVTTLDITNQTGLTIFAEGASLVGTDDTVEAVVDFMGSASIVTYGLTINSQTGVSPRIGMQGGRWNGTTAVGGHTHFGLGISGEFSFASLYLNCTEIMEFLSPSIVNILNSTSSYALVMDGANMWTQYSPHLDHTTGPNTNKNARLITGISNGAVARVTSPSHGWTADFDREAVRIREVAGMTEINSFPKAAPADDSTTYYFKFVDANNFDLYTDSGLTTGLDTTAYGAYTSGGLVGWYELDGFGLNTFSVPTLRHDDGPVVWMGPSLAYHRYLNGYVLGQDTTVGSSMIHIHSDHDFGGRMQALTLDLSRETDDPDYYIKFSGESTYLTIPDFAGKPAVLGTASGAGHAAFTTATGMTIDLPGFDWRMSGNQNTYLFETGTTFNVIGSSSIIGSNVGGSPGLGMPSTYNGIIYGYDANDLVFGAGTQMLVSMMMDGIANPITYIPIKGQFCWFGTAAGTYATETLELEDDICVDGESIRPGANDDADLGTTAIGWSDLYIAGGGGTIKWGNDETIADGADTISFTGATSNVFGHTAALSLLGNPQQIEVLGTTAPLSSIATVRFSNTATASNWILGKSRGATIDSWTIVALDDMLGQFIFAGADGTDLGQAASIAAFVDDTPGAGTDMPGRIVFSTSPNGSETVAERFRINSKGHGEWTAASAPTSDCGTSDTFETGSTDVVGRIEVGTTPGASCTLTFAAAWTNAPHCSVNNEDSVARAVTMVTSTTTNVLITFAAAPDAADSISYHCVGFTG
jgi:hypothetical protein